MCDTEAGRHWHAGSERYTSTDQLETALLNGWEISWVSFQEHWLRGKRKVVVYQVELVQDDEVAVMAVVANPYAERLMTQFSLNLLSVNASSLFGDIIYAETNGLREESVL